MQMREVALAMLIIGCLLRVLICCIACYTGRSQIRRIRELRMPPRSSMRQQSPLAPGRRKSETGSRNASPSRQSPMGARRASSPVMPRPVKTPVERSSSGEVREAAVDRRTPTVLPAAAAPTPSPPAEVASGQRTPQSGSITPSLSTSHQDAGDEHVVHQREALEAHLRELEQSLRLYQNIMSSNEKRHRAEDLRSQRIPPLLEQCDTMRKEIAALRNSDRILVSLREERDALVKHLRLRKAQVRQKEATIDIITKRFREQSEGSQQLLSDIRQELQFTESLCVEMQRREGLANTIEPSMCQRKMISHDEERYLVSDESMSVCASHSQRSVEQDEHIEQVKRSCQEIARVLEDRENRSGGLPSGDEDVKAMVAAHAKRWDAEKVVLLREKDAVQRQLRDNAFHVRRGTNIKTMSQFPCSANTGFLVEQVRELQLTLTELVAGFDNDAKTYNEQHRKLSTLSSVFAEECVAGEEALAQLQHAREAIEAENKQLIDYESILHGRCNSENRISSDLVDVSAATALVLSSPQPRAESASCVVSATTTEYLDALVQRCREKANAAALAKRPARLIDRLSAPTKSFETFVAVQRREQSERNERLSSVSTARPLGCAGSPSASARSPVASKRLAL